MGSDSLRVQKQDWSVDFLGFEVHGGKNGVQHIISPLTWR